MLKVGVSIGCHQRRIKYFKCNLEKKPKLLLHRKLQVQPIIKKENCYHSAIFKCNLPKEPKKQNKIVVMLQASSVTYQRKCTLLYTKPKNNTIGTHPTKESAKFFF